MKKVVLAVFTAALLTSALQAQSAPPAEHPKPVKHRSHKAGKHGKHHQKKHHSA